MKNILLFTIAIFLITNSRATTWNIGSTETYTLPSQVKNLVNNGDTILIDGGVYLNDATKWTKKNLFFIGLGTGSNRTILRHSGNIANNKGIFVFENPGTNDNTYIENIVFDGAQISDAAGGNGAGIRFQAKNLNVNKCKFMNCQNGILEGNNSVNNSVVTIMNSEFENNGYQQPNNSNFSGYEHNIYINASTDSLLVTNCYFHHPRGQSNSIKTRAQKSYILYNYIDEDTGFGSWEINIAQGGLNVIMGNVIIQGPTGANHGIIGYDAASNPLEDFYFINNTVINKYVGNIKYFNTSPSSGINTYKIYNNIFASVSGANNTLFTGNIPSVLDSSNNLLATNYLNLGFVNPAANDYSLIGNAPLIINKGTNAGVLGTSFLLTPLKMYKDFTQPLLTRSTSGIAIDLGAYEFKNSIGINEINGAAFVEVYPNPCTGIIHVKCVECLPNNNLEIKLFDQLGRLIIEKRVKQTNTSIHLLDKSKGIYYLQAIVDKYVLYQKILIM